MLCPIRCFSCNKVLGDKWRPYQAMLNEGTSSKDAMHTLKITRYCCKRMMLCNVDNFDKLLCYFK